MTYPHRARQIVVLARVDLHGAPHRNPDGKGVPCPHLHLYREGYGDKWAAPLPLDHFSNATDLWQTLRDFMTYGNIVAPPTIRQGLFE